MELDSSETWRWIWLIAAAVFATSELVMAGTFFMLSFAIGAALAALVSFAGAAPLAGWAVFVVASAIALLVLVPIGRRINRSGEPASTVGANRWGGKRALVVGGIPGNLHATGLVRVEREEWRAESVDGSAIPTGTEVRVVRVDGTRLVVAPVAGPEPGS